jgi:hypothetical protein
MVKNDVIFRGRNPSVDACKNYIFSEALLLLHRIKVRVVPLLES